MDVADVRFKFTYSVSEKNKSLTLMLSEKISNRKNVNKKASLFRSVTLSRFESDDSLLKKFSFLVMYLKIKNVA